MPQDHRIVIKGITNEGRAFRPSDWAQRLATAVGIPGPDRRVLFHPCVHQAMHQNVNCVVVEARLREEDPRLFAFLLNFAKNNNLQVEDTESPRQG